MCVCVRVSVCMMVWEHNGVSVCEKERKECVGVWACDSMRGWVCALAIVCTCVCVCVLVFASVCV